MTAGLVWQYGVDLSAANSLRLPCRVAHCAHAGSEAAVLDALARARQADLPLRVLGGGSNVVLPRVFEGVMLSVTDASVVLLAESAHGVRVQAGAGANWDSLIRWCAGQGWWGIENLALIPGSVGAAPVQNIGAYGQELADVCVRVRAIERTSGTVHDLEPAECGFGYRDSRFRRSPDDWVVVAVELELAREGVPRCDYPGVAAMLEEQGAAGRSPMELVRAISALRRQKLPDPARLPNAGSFFKNPLLRAADFAELAARFPGLPGRADARDVVKVPAAWLIEHCGWRGQRRGAVGVSASHALVLVHHGGGDADDLLALARAIMESVEARFGVVLEREPVVM